jgi:hypothetical protein
VKRVLMVLAICLVFFGITSFPSTVLAKRPDPSPTPPPINTIPGLCMFYYGGFDAGGVTLKRITSAKPEMIVTETPGGTYGTPCPIEELHKAGIKVYSYVAVGYLRGYIWDPQSPDRNSYTDIMADKTGFLAKVAEEGCDGVFFDESLFNLLEKGPADSDRGGTNSWAGKTMAEPIERAHDLHLKVMLGLGSPDFHTNLLDTNTYGFKAADFILSEEWYAGRAPKLGEIGAKWAGFEDNDGKDHTSQCIVIGYSVGNAKKAFGYTNTAWSYHFRGAYQSNGLGTLASWFEDYISSLRNTGR